MQTPQETHFSRRLPEGAVLCTLCPQACRLQEGERGLCRVRFRHGDKVCLSSYGQVSALALDPIEKKPLYHFYPGALILSVGTVGCNLRCGFCQNWEIAHGEAPTEYLSPKNLVELADNYRARGNIGLAYTYSEPLVWYEYVYDTARLAREKGLKNVLVTNGYLNPEPLRELLPFIDAVNLDIKAWEDGFYRRHCEGRVGPVRKAAEIMAKMVHLEVTNLLIPGENDQEEEIRELVRFLAGLDRRIPLHFSRYFPHYQLELPPTPLRVLENAFKLAKEELHYVYIGNISAVDARTGYNRTNCPDCEQVQVERAGFAARVTGVDQGRCSNCGREVDLVLPTEGDEER